MHAPRYRGVGMRLKAALAVAMMVGLLAAPVASGDGLTEAAPGFPITDPVHLPMVESLEPVAEAYWAQRGITLPTPVEVFAIQGTPLEGAFGDEPGNRVWLTETILGRKGTQARVALCMIYLHERGHNAGLVHGSGDPIMRANPWEAPSFTPPKCFKWAEWGYRAALGRYYR